MGIALIIVGGLVLMTVFAAGADFLTKRKGRLDTQTVETVAELQQRVTSLEQMVKEKDDTVARLETDMSFIRKLIEK